MNQISVTSPSPLRVPATAPGSFPPGNIALICSRWHSDIVDQARHACIAELHASGAPPGSIREFEVPGAFEIPLLAQRLARSGRYAAVIACGFVVDGGIYRHDFVASAVIDGLMHVQLDTDVAVFSAVLTPHEFHDHAEHQQFFAKHFVRKGIEVAQACVQTLSALGTAGTSALRA